MSSIHIKINKEDDFDKLLNKFEKVCKKDGFMQEIRERRFYKKPSEKKREYLRKLKRKHKK